METNYEESYRRIMEYQNEEHLRNQKKNTVGKSVVSF